MYKYFLKILVLIPIHIFSNLCFMKVGNFLILLLKSSSKIFNYQLNSLSLTL